MGAGAGSILALNNPKNWVSVEGKDSRACCVATTCAAEDEGEGEDGSVTGNSTESIGVAGSRLRQAEARADIATSSVILGSPTSSTLCKPSVSCSATRSDCFTLASTSAKVIPDSTRVTSKSKGAASVEAAVLPVVGACVGAMVDSGLGGVVGTRESGRVGWPFGGAIAEGASVGNTVADAEGSGVGLAVGTDVGVFVGTSVDSGLGAAVGTRDGGRVGRLVDRALGGAEGRLVDRALGGAEGRKVGCGEGRAEGRKVVRAVGLAVDRGEGIVVGASEEIGKLYDDKKVMVALPLPPISGPPKLYTVYVAPWAFQMMTELSLA